MPGLESVPRLFRVIPHEYHSVSVSGLVPAGGAGHPAADELRDHAAEEHDNPNREFTEVSGYCADDLWCRIHHHIDVPAVGAQRCRQAGLNLLEIIAGYCRLRRRSLREILQLGRWKLKPGSQSVSASKRSTSASNSDRPIFTTYSLKYGPNIRSDGTTRSSQ